MLPTLRLRRVLTPSRLGVAGERRARLFYRLRGFRIVARNLRFDDGEIDMVAARGSLLVFVEVKSRQQEQAGAPWEAVDRRKQQQIVRLAQRFLHRSGHRPKTIRFDVVSLYWTGLRFRVEHFAAAFEAQWDEQRPWKLAR